MSNFYLQLLSRCQVRPTSSPFRASIPATASAAFSPPSHWISVANYQHPEQPLQVPAATQTDCPQTNQSTLNLCLATARRRHLQDSIHFCQERYSQRRSIAATGCRRHHHQRVSFVLMVAKAGRHLMMAALAGAGCHLLRMVVRQFGQDCWRHWLCSQMI